MAMLRTGNVEAGRMAKAEPRTAESPDRGWLDSAEGRKSHQPEEHPPGCRQQPTPWQGLVRHDRRSEGLEDTADLTVEVQAGAQERVGDTDVVADGDDDVQRSGLSSRSIVAVFPQSIQSNSTIAQDAGLTVVRTILEDMGQPQSTILLLAYADDEVCDSTTHQDIEGGKRACCLPQETILTYAIVEDITQERSLLLAGLCPSND